MGEGFPFLKPCERSPHPLQSFREGGVRAANIQPHETLAARPEIRPVVQRHLGLFEEERVRMAGYARFPAICGPISHESLPTLDTDLAAKAMRGPVAPAQHSEAALAFDIVTTPSALPRRTLDLIQKIRP